MRIRLGRRRIFLILGLLLLFIGLLAGSFVRSKNKSSTPYVVEEKTLRKVVYASGYVRPKDYVLVKAEVSGYVKELRVKEGDKVSPGQILVLLDAKPLEASLKEAEYRLDLIKSKLNPDSEYLKTLKEQAKIAKTNLEQAERNLERRQKLWEDGLISKEQYEEAKRTYENAKSEYVKSIAIYQDTIKTLSLESQIVQSNIRKIKEELNKYVIRSPIEGVVLSKFINVGDYVNHLSQDNRLFSLGGKELEIVLSVDEEFLSLIKEGNKVFLTLEAYPKEPFEGRIFQIIREVDPNKRTFEVKVTANLPKEVPASATVEANILVLEKKSLVIPKSYYKDGFVYKYEEGKIQKIPVKIGSEFDGFLEVREGLKKGDRILHK